MSGILRAELSAAAWRHNVAAVRGLIGPDVALCAVVKANAYGHGLEALLPEMRDAVDWLAVTLPATALRVRELGWRGPVLAFFRAAGSAPREMVESKIEELARADVTVTVAGAADLDLLAVTAARVGRPVDVHLKIDTGMTRSGVLPAGAGEWIGRLRGHSGVRLTGVYTQIAAADSADLDSARRQLEVFEEVLSAAGGADGLLVHAANSAATLALPESHYDMVRPGLALYGCYPTPEMARPLPLRPVLRLCAQLLEIKTVAAGSRTGYGLTHTFERESRIGLVSVGYADGYPRILGGRATMRVQGFDVPVCGRVSMDQVVVDLTGAPGCEIGDEVEVISNDPLSPHSLERLAELAGTVPYEISCGLGLRVERRLIAG